MKSLWKNLTGLLLSVLITTAASGQVGFTGGGKNAVTRMGSNQVQDSA
jgi:hypothetical protein